MAKKTNSKTKISKAKPEIKSRKIKQTPYRTFRLSKRIKHPGKKLPSSLQLLRISIKHLLSHPKLYFGIILVYFALTLVLVKGFGISSGLPELKDTLQEAFSGATGQLASSAALFGFLLTSAGSQASEVASTYQSILLIIISLALIWTLRQTHADNEISLKDSFYKGMYPLVPFVLVLLVIGLQLIPLLIGNGLYTIVTQNGIAVTGFEQTLWLLIFFLFALLSLYMVSSSIFALYIVTLPNITPMQALRSARELVRYRRWTVMRKVFIMPIMLVLIAALIMVPLLIFVTPIAEWVFFAMTMSAVAVVHSYMYTLYRELL